MVELLAAWPAFRTSTGPGPQMKNRAPEQQPWTVPAPGETFAGKYVIDGVCGRGGLAVVLSAVHPGLGQRVAIKMLLPEWANDFDVVERFLREGRAATRIKSQHVVRVFDVDTLPSGAPYLVLEYLEGHNLDDVVSMWGPLPIETAIDWVLQACEAISEAHAVGIVHRDLKPGNLFLTRLADGSDCVKVIDFGLSKLAESFMPEGSAKLTRPNDVMGSPHYMAPEQLRAMREADERTDLWALGAVLYELIAGKTPFHGESMAELCAAVLTRVPEPLSSLRPEVPPPVEAAVQRCLEKDPAARFASAAELARALAPHGTPLSRTSCMRIERVLEGRASVLPAADSSEPPRRGGPLAGDEDWGDALSSIPGTHTSAKVVLGSFLMLAGLGIGVFMWMYDAVHAGDPPNAPVAAPLVPARPSPVYARETPPPPVADPAPPVVALEPPPPSLPPAAPLPPSHAPTRTIYGEEERRPQAPVAPKPAEPAPPQPVRPHASPPPPAPQVTRASGDGIADPFAAKIAPGQDSPSSDDDPFVHRK
jgi:serine/threonine-protein kinase